MSRYCIELINKEFEQRRARNPQYSLRAFARSLAIDVSVLSKIMHERLGISKKIADILLEKLSLTDEEKRCLVDSLAYEKGSHVLSSHAIVPTENQMQAISQDTFRLIADWYHYAILELSFLPNRTMDPLSIAQCLGIELSEATLAIERLLGLGLLSRNEAGRLEKTQRQLTTTDRSVVSLATKEFHKQILEKAVAAVHDIPEERRTFFGMTMAIDPDKLPIARSLIEGFVNHLAQILESGKVSHLYQLEVGLFPLEK